MDQTISLMKESFPHLIKNNFTHQAVWGSFANVTGDGMETSTMPQ